MPCGRLAWSFYLVHEGCGKEGPYIDLSVMPVGSHGEENQFQKVHRLAKEERLRRHALGCVVCQSSPSLCIFRAQILGVPRSEWLKQQKGDA
jgi:hypothetical protein